MAEKKTRKEAQKNKAAAKREETSRKRCSLEKKVIHTVVETYIPPVGYDVIRYSNGAREIEFHIGEGILSFGEFQRIVAEEFSGKTKTELDNMSFHAEDGIVVIGEIDWLVEE